MPELVDRGLRVSVLLTEADDYDIDKPGKDSFEHRAAGATEVMISSERRWALTHENRAAPDAARTAVIDRMAPVDLLLLVGGAAEAEGAIALCEPEGGIALSCRQRQAAASYPK